MTPADKAGPGPDLPADGSLSAWLSQHAFTLAVMALVVGAMVWYGVDFLNVGKVAVGLGHRPHQVVVGDPQVVADPLVGTAPPHHALLFLQLLERHLGSSRSDPTFLLLRRLARE